MRREMRRKSEIIMYYIRYLLSTGDYLLGALVQFIKRTKDGSFWT